MNSINNTKENNILLKTTIQNNNNSASQRYIDYNSENIQTVDRKTQ